MGWLGVIAVVAVAACYEPSVQPGVPCAANGACPSGLSCVAGVCGGSVVPHDGALPGDTPADGWHDATDASVTSPDAPAFAIRIDIAGGAYTGIDHPGDWAADPGVGGICDGMPFTSPTPTVSGTMDSPLYVDQMFNGILTCSVPNVPPGTYRVTLLFAELRLGGPPCTGPAGQHRVFDIALEGATVATAFDLTATGGGCAAAGGSGHVVDESYTVAVADGALEVVETASMGAAALNAIELVRQ